MRGLTLLSTQSTISERGAPRSNALARLRSGGCVCVAVLVLVTGGCNPSHEGSYAGDEASAEPSPRSDECRLRHRASATPPPRPRAPDPVS
jgi:hypothetical protein